MNSKITTEHLARMAYVYVRQSSPDQVRNNRVLSAGMRIVLTDVLRRAGVKPMRGAVGPRIHDMRHTMVGHRMRDWYKSGVNPQSRLPYLATYLGHKDIRSTLVYLNITPELLQEAGERFRKNSVAALGAAEGTR